MINVTIFLCLLYIYIENIWNIFLLNHVSNFFVICLNFKLNWASCILFGNHTSEPDKWLILLGLNLTGRKLSGLLPQCSRPGWSHVFGNLMVACTKLTKEVKGPACWPRNWERPSKIGWRVGCLMENRTGKGWRPHFGPGLYTRHLNMNTRPCSIMATFCWVLCTSYC